MTGNIYDIYDGSQLTIVSQRINMICVPNLNALNYCLLLPVAYYYIGLLAKVLHCAVNDTSVPKINASENYIYYINYQVHTFCLNRTVHFFSAVDRLTNLIQNYKVSGFLVFWATVCAKCANFIMAKADHYF